MRDFAPVIGSAAKWEPILNCVRPSLRAEVEELIDPFQEEDFRLKS